MSVAQFFMYLVVHVELGTFLSFKFLKSILGPCNFKSHEVINVFEKYLCFTILLQWISGSWQKIIRSVLVMSDLTDTELEMRFSLWIQSTYPYSSIKNYLLIYSQLSAFVPRTCLNTIAMVQTLS